MVPSQEANNDNLGFCFDFLHNYCMLCVLIRIASSRHHFQSYCNGVWMWQELKKCSLSYFPKKTWADISGKLSPKEITCIKFQTLFS